MSVLQQARQNHEHSRLALGRMTYLDRILLQHLLLLKLQLLLTEVAITAADSFAACHAAALLLFAIVRNQEHHACCCQDKNGVARPMACGHQLQLRPGPSWVPMAEQPTSAAGKKAGTDMSAQRSAGQDVIMLVRTPIS
jgi:hypothetical protein